MYSSIIALNITRCDRCFCCLFFFSQAYHAVLQLAEAREKFSAFRIPMVIIPATISNNVPGTDLSLGVDTALNVITEVSLLLCGSYGMQLPLTAYKKLELQTFNSVVSGMMLTMAYVASFILNVAHFKSLFSWVLAFSFRFFPFLLEKTCFRLVG